MKKVNNQFYHELGEQWYRSQDDAISLLRLEAQTKNPWVLSQINKFYGQKVKVLDIGCGGGFLSNYLAQDGHEVTGIDLSSSSLEIARHFDSTRNVTYFTADATEIPLPSQSFDVVCAMDFLEHVEDPAQVIKEASRLLRPGGLFFYHTFNRNWLSFFLVIKMMDWFVPNIPKNLHVYRLFIRPYELNQMMQKVGLEKVWAGGLLPNFLSFAFISSILRRKIHPLFKFTICSSTLVAYIGFSKKSDKK